MNSTELRQFIESEWDNHILPTLADYIRIPNKSPHFDPDWQANGYMAQAVHLIRDWCLKHAPIGMQLEVIQSEGRTPLLWIEIPGQSDRTVLLYGHLDKQPEMTGWREGLGPWEPVFTEDKLYGRGGADDGYSVFAALTAINALQAQKIPHDRCIILIEASEESGSPDLPFYMEKLENRIGKPHLVIGLDSGCANYEQLWVTTSLRGVASFLLKVEVLTEGIHSGASGTVASSFRIARHLLDRIEDSQTGQLLLPELKVDIPQQRVEQSHESAAELGQAYFEDSLPLVEGVQPESSDPVELFLKKTWHPALSVIGIDGLSASKNAGNVLKPYTALKLSFRLPPTCDASLAAEAIQKTLEADPPYQARVSCKILSAEPGWSAPIFSPHLIDVFEKASQTFFGRSAMYMGEGGSIPFMGMLGRKFPEAQFLITGVLGPHSNAHGPNEFLHIPTAQRITSAVAFVIANTYQAG